MGTIRRMKMRKGRRRETKVLRKLGRRRKRRRNRVRSEGELRESA